MTAPERYGESVLSPDWHGERDRLLAMAEVADPTTVRVLRDLGIAPDWHCLEVGAGAGTIARWLAEQVPDGGVLATDIDTRWLNEGDAPSLRVAEHDITRDPLPTSAFDLVHVRFVLEHLLERDAVLAKLCRSLRPGGRRAQRVGPLLVVHPDPAPPAHRRACAARPGRGRRSPPAAGRSALLRPDVRHRCLLGDVPGR